MRTLLRFLGPLITSTSMILALASITGARGQGSGEVALPACDAAAAETASEQLLTTESALAADLPAGLALAVLADEATEQWPPFARGLVLTVRSLTLDPGVTSATRQTQGPLLFYVETGVVGFSINGQLLDHEQGDAVLIERGQNYQLRNDDPVNAATLVRVQVVPPGKETKVARGDIADVRDDEQAFSPGPPFIQSRLLLTADVPAVEGSTRLVLGCLTWVDPTTDPGEVAHPGPIGLLVLRGQLLVGDAGSLAAGECTVFQRQVPHRLRAGTPAPVVLVVGVLPDGARLWGAPPGETETTFGGRFEFDCDPEAEPDAIPDAAETLPHDAKTRGWL